MTGLLQTIARTRHAVSRGRRHGVRIVCGRYWLAPEDLACLGPGRMLELPADASDPVEIWLGGELAAVGELVELDGRLAVRVTRPAGDAAREEEAC